jgi:hypothetical protein
MFRISHAMQLDEGTGRPGGDDKQCKIICVTVRLTVQMTKRRPRNTPDRNTTDTAEIFLELGLSPMRASGQQ